MPLKYFFSHPNTARLLLASPRPRVLKVLRLRVSFPLQVLLIWLTIEQRGHEGNTDLVVDMSQCTHWYVCLNMLFDHVD